jgi:hypothetical protein
LKTKDDKEKKPLTPFEERMSTPLGLGPGGQLLIFNTIEEAREYKRKHPPIIINMDDAGEIPDEHNYDKL